MQIIQNLKWSSGKHVHNRKETLCCSHTYTSVFLFFLLKGLESIGLKRILNIWELSQGVVPQQPRQQPKCEIHTNAHFIYPLIFIYVFLNNIV